MARCAVLVLALLALTATTTHAHALLLRSDPSTGVALATQPRHVSFWFSEPVQVAFNGVAVVDTSDHRVDNLDAQVAGDDSTRVDVSLGEMPDGSYVARWQVTSADNHVVRGTTWFAVGFAVSPPPVATLVGSTSSPLPEWEVLGRWLVYLAVLALAGVPAFRVLVLRNQTLTRETSKTYARLGQRSVVVAGGALLVGQVLWLLAQMEAVAATDMPRAFSAPVLQVVLFGSRFALLWWLRSIAGLALAATLAVSRTRGDRLALVLSFAVLASISAGGHAAGVPVAAGLAVLNDLVHLGAAAVWLGGLLQLVLLLRSLGRTASTARADVLRDLVPRVSQVALLCVGLIVVTGTLSAWTEIQTLPALLTTAYGQALVVKVCLVLLLLAIATANLLVMRPRFARTGAAGPRSTLTFAGLVRAEVAVGVLVAAATGLLTSLPPPGQQPAPAQVTAARQAGDLRITLTADPVWVGISRFSVELQDDRGQPPADVQSVMLTFAMQGMNMGRTNVAAAPATAGGYAAEGYFVGMPGISEIGVAVQRATGSSQSAVFQVEVPDISESQFEGLRAVAGPGSSTRNAPTAESLERGQLVYADHCAVCHGSTGVGNGPAASALLPPPADLTLHARWHGDPQLFWFVTNGMAGTAMPSFADTLSETERWDAIDYLHQLAEAPTATVQVSPAAPAPVPLTVPTPPVAASPAPAATQSSEPVSTLRGRIVYGPDTDHDFWVLDLPDGRPRQITAYGRLDFASSPDWSPDGKQVAYSFYQLPGGTGIPLPPGTDVYAMNADGTSPRLIAEHDVPGAVLQTPLWSPDSASLYVSYQAQRSNGGLDVGIDRLDAASGARTRVVPNAIAPAISRDGRLLAYAALPNGTVRSFTLWRSASDGSAPLQLIGPNVFVRYQGLRFSPDGRQIVFAAVGNGQGFSPPSGLLYFLTQWLGPRAAYADGDLWDLWIVDVDGHNLRRLTAINEDLPISAWSPDGRAVAFLGGGSTITAQGGVTVVDANGGSDVQRLTVQPGHRGLDWTARP